MDRKEQRTANSTYKKLAVQWLNEALCPENRDFVVAESLVLRNRQLLVAANRYASYHETLYNNHHSKFDTCFWL